MDFISYLAGISNDKEANASNKQKAAIFTLEPTLHA
jgi:hypothetical protein